MADIIICLISNNTNIIFAHSLQSRKDHPKVALIA